MSNKENGNLMTNLALQRNPVSLSGRSASGYKPIDLTGDSTRRGSPQFLDTKRCGRCCRRDDGSPGLGRRENRDGHRHDCRRRLRAAKGSPPPLSADLDVVKKEKGPVLTTADEFYKVGPGPSSSHTIGPMRITYDFYQRCTKLPADKLAKATKLQVNLFGSLSATGKGHGTERAALAGLVGKEPATVDPKFLDGLRDKPDQVFPVKLGNKSIDVSLKDVIYDATKGDFKHPNTMTVSSSPATRCCSSRSTTPWAADSSSGKGTRPRRRTRRSTRSRR